MTSHGRHWICVLLGIVLISASHPLAFADDIDATTLHKKVLTGYQGWFRCPGDGGKIWKHWSRNGQRIAPETLTFEMWPDLSDFTEAEKYPAPGFTHADGSPAHLFSSANPKTVQRHFDWMKTYGIDGIFLQRFLVDLPDKSVDTVLENVRTSAKQSGRIYAICYDLSGASKDKMFDTLVTDWKRLVDERKITADDRYLHHNKKPVVFVWGFYSDRFGPELAGRIIDFFTADTKYGATLVGGCQWYWRREKNPEWAKVFRRFNVISPWNVGNTTLIDGKRHAATHTWKDDIDEARQAGMEFLPVVYPGFGWTNLRGPKAANDDVNRLGGQFLWRQFSTVRDLNIDMAYVAMFDEVDEATAIFKVSDSPPKQAHFQTYDGRPSDWYLRLTGEGTKLIRGDIANSKTIPIRP
jgi:hypothetical protein